MLSYTDFIANEDMLSEKAITIGGKMYPKFNQVVIMAGGAGCFGPETLIETEHGHKAIKDIETGEKVWSLNEKTNEKELQEVTNTFVYGSEVKPMLELKFEMDNKTIETVLCTEDHEFYIDGEYIKAKDLIVE